MNMDIEISVYQHFGLPLSGNDSGGGAHPVVSSGVTDIPKATSSLAPSLNASLFTPPVTREPRCHQVQAILGRQTSPPHGILPPRKTRLFTMRVVVA